MPLESRPSQEVEKAANEKRVSLDDLKENVSGGNLELDGETIRQSGEKVFILQQTTRLKDISKEQAEAVKILKSDQPCLFQYYAYRGTYVHKTLDRVKVSKEFTILREVTPLNVSDLKQKGFRKKRVTHRLIEPEGLSETELELSALGDTLKFLGYHLRGETGNSVTVGQENGTVDYLEKALHSTLDAEMDYVISGLRISKKEGDEYEVSFDLYEKSKG